MPEINKDIYKNIARENLSIEITTRCNNKCVHCFARASLSEEHELSFSVISDIIHEGYNTGYRFLHITGGEPFLHKDIFKIFELAKKTGYERIYCNTDGSFFTNTIPAQLLELKKYLNFFVSLHGDKNLHDKIRGKKNWHIIQNGLKNGLKNDLNITIYSSVGKSLLKQLPLFVKNTFQNFPRIERITLIQMQYVYNKNFDLSSEILEPSEFIDFIKIISLLVLGNYSISVLDNAFACVVADKLGIKWINKAPQIFRSGRLFIMANKKLTFNHSAKDNYGDYKSGILGKILSSDDYLKSLLPDQKICPNCKHVALCKKNNMIKPTNLIYDLNTKDPYCKRTLDLLSD